MKSTSPYLQEFSVVNRTSLAPVLLLALLPIDGRHAALAQSLSLDAAAPPSKDQIVFVSTRDGTKQIYSMSADGGDQRRLTKSNTSDYEPCWSPDGRYIAFSREANGIAEVCVMNADGTQVEQLTTNRSISAGPTWSPDGKHIAYHTWDSDNWEIYVVDVKGGDARNLTNSPHTETYPHFSPDGSQIVFHRLVNDDDWNICVLKNDGAGLRTLTSDAGRDWLPTWSPDGQKIAFWSTRTGDWELFLMDRDGSNQSQISNENGRVNNWISRAAWSPDGQSLAIVANPEAKNLDVVRVRVSGGDVGRLTSATSEDSDPDWTRSARQ